MTAEIQDYIARLQPTDQQTAKKLVDIIDARLPEAESKIWHAHPVWFLEGATPLWDSAGLSIIYGCSFGADSHLTKRPYSQRVNSKQLKHVTCPSMKLTRMN